MYHYLHFFFVRKNVFTTTRKQLQDDGAFGVHYGIRGQLKRKVDDGQPPRALQLDLEEALYLMRIGRLEIFTTAATKTREASKKYDTDAIIERVHTSSARLLILAGLPGSGKSTFSKTLQDCTKGGRDSAWVRVSQDEEGTLPRTKSIVRWVRFCVCLSLPLFSLMNNIYTGIGIVMACCCG